MENSKYTPQQISQRIEQLQTSRVIIDNKITRLEELRKITLDEIDRLTTTTAQPQVNVTLGEADTYLHENGMTYHFPLWVTLHDYAVAYGLASTEIIDDWIEMGIVPAYDTRTFSYLDGLRLIRDKPYV